MERANWNGAPITEEATAVAWKAYIFAIGNNLHVPIEEDEDRVTARKYDIEDWNRRVLQAVARGGKPCNTIAHVLIPFIRHQSQKEMQRLDEMGQGIPLWDTTANDQKKRGEYRKNSRLLINNMAVQFKALCDTLRQFGDFSDINDEDLNYHYGTNRTKEEK